VTKKEEDCMKSIAEMARIERQILDARARRGLGTEKKKAEKRGVARISSIVRRGARGSRRAFACQDWSMHHPNLCIRSRARAHARARTPDV